MAAIPRVAGLTGRSRLATLCVARTIPASSKLWIGSRKFSDGGFQALEAQPWLDHQNPHSDDHAQITNLLSHYSWLINFPPRDDLSSVFTEDAVMELPELGHTTTGGHAAIAKMIKDIADHQDYLKHHVTNTQIKVQGDKAMARCYLFGAIGRKGTPGGDHMTEGGRYYDQLIRTSGGWRIKKRTIYLDWTAGNVEVANVKGTVGATIAESESSK